jgi:sulfatase modifying factor 1
VVALAAFVGTFSFGCSRRDPTAEMVSKALEAPRVVPMTSQHDSPTLPDAATGMVRVTGGAFRMHDSELQAGQEVTVHTPSIMTVSSFELDATEVTVGAYLECVKNGACGALRPDFSSNSACIATKPGMGLRPMECITWFEATAYCQAQGKRLPTEIEWEYAARGGPKNTDYPWGNDDPERTLALLCWTGSGTWRGETCRVASFPAEAFGTYDLAGNVAEWTSTVEDSAYFGEKKGKPHPYRVVRGGSSGTNVRRGIVGHRLEDADYTSAGIGVRCARDGSPDAGAR